MKNIIEMDKTCGGLDIALPAEHQKLGLEMRLFLSQAFAFEPINEKVIAEMNQLARQWLNKRGINISGEEA